MKTKSHLPIVAYLVLLAFTALFTANAMAQQYAVTTVSYVGGLTTNQVVTTDSAAITLTKYEDVGLYFSFVGDGAATDNVVFTFKKSIDGSNYATIGGPAFAIPATGTTAVHWVTNFNAGPVGYLKLDSVANGAAVNLTNLVIKYSLKPKRSMQQ